MTTTAVASRIHPQQVYGLVAPTSLTGPLREAVVKYGRGVLVEEATTNLITNPSFEAGTTGWAAQGSYTVAQSSERAFVGTKSLKVTATATTAGGASFAVSMTSGQTYALSVWVWVGLLKSGTTVRIVDNGGTPLTGATTAAQGNGWVRIGGTFVAGSTASLTFYVHTSTTVNAGDYFYVDAAQAENKSIITSYTDGSLATAWDAPGNLLPTAMQSFEDGSLGGMVLSAGTATLANSAAQVYAGTKSLLLTVGATATLGVTGATGTAASPVVAGRAYTGSLWVRPSAARQLRADILWYTAAGAFISASANTVTGVATTWTRQSVTAVAPATAAFATVGFASTDATNADTFYLDGLRLAEGTGAGSYRWTGAENASTSTRANGGLIYPTPTVPSARVTVCAWVRTSTATANPAFLVRLGADDNNNFSLFLNGASVTARKTVGGVSVDAIGGTWAAGDLLFIALVYDSTNLVAYLSKNGGAVTTATTASATLPTAATQLAIGSTLAGTGIANAGIEQALVYDSALSAGDIAALAFHGDGTGMAEDSRLVFAALAPEDETPVYLSALSLSGTGRLRRRGGATQNPAVTVEVGTPHSFAATGAVLTVRLPDGSGAGTPGVGESFLLEDGSWHTVVGTARGAAEDLLYTT